jgi:hypothetical protein
MDRQTVSMTAPNHTSKAAAFSSHRGFAIGSHHDLRDIGKGFRASKPDLQARPVCHHKANRSMPASPSCSPT